MMTAKRIIPCLDMKGGKVVKGIQFEDIRDVGEPVEMSKGYQAQGADEITLLDISASLDTRDSTLRMVSEISDNLSIPFCVGGGVKDVAYMRMILDAGADKVSIGSASVADPDIISRCSDMFGKRSLVVAIDAKRKGDGWKVFTAGGRNDTGLDAVEWAIKAADLGAGEILLTSMDADGERSGYDIPLTAAVSEAVDIPVTASGGCGSMEHIFEVLINTDAAAALAASVFHYGRFTVSEVKDYLKDKGIAIK
ncbi:MAG TPA: imidazole glycerol phosphate synthase subunit HisF [Candidatus Methanomethylophilaceae archaeon]|nr:imidazole glycerol phosphate synthase subunit HisF [Candidatus Methanomethylophilaceae archaeon]